MAPAMMRQGLQYAAANEAACPRFNRGQDPHMYDKRECTKAAATCDLAARGSFLLLKKVLAKVVVAAVADALRNATSMPTQAR